MENPAARNGWFQGHGTPSNDAFLQSDESDVWGVGRTVCRFSRRRSCSAAADNKLGLAGQK
jgi:hypothetical protein